jgi:hypothetical protein
MGLQTSGPISLGDVRTELGESGAIGLGNSNVRTLAGVASGAISLGNLYGKSSATVFHWTGSGVAGPDGSSWFVINETFPSAATFTNVKATATVSGVQAQDLSIYINVGGGLWMTPDGNDHPISATVSAGQSVHFDVYNDSPWNDATVTELTVTFS